MKVIGVIPARYASSRLQGKVLADIMGKPMIQHVWENAKQAIVLDEVIIACDDERIAAAGRRFSAKVALTAEEHITGTDRIIEIINPLDVKIVINIQADEPLVCPEMIDMLAQALIDDHRIPMATLVKKIDDPLEINDPHVVKVVMDKDNFALYFSRAAIPYHPDNSGVKEPVYYKHIGLYGYTKDFLFTYKNLPVSRLETTERLEQLRVLEAGYRIKAVETKHESIGVDTPEDLEKVRGYLKTK